MQRKRSREFSLRQLFLTLVCTIFLVVATSFVLMYRYVQDFSYHSVELSMNHTHDQIISRLDEYYTSIENTSYSFCYSPTTQQYLLSESVDERASMQLTMRSVFSGTYLLLEELKGIQIFNQDGVSIGRYVKNSGNYPVFFESIPEDYADIYGNQYALLEEGDGMTTLPYGSFSMFSPVYALSETRRNLGKRIGFVMMTLDSSYLSSLLFSSSVPNGYHTVLTDPNGRLIAASSDAAAEFYLSELSENAEIPSRETTLKQSGWQLHSYLIQSVINKEIEPLLVITYVTGAVFFVLLLIILFFLQRKILTPIRRLSNFMQDVPSRPRPVCFPFHQHNELGKMIDIFNRMLHALDEKSVQLRESEAKAFALELSQKQMEVLAYRNQINPHFIYNTLDCMRGIAFYYEASEIVSITESLSSMFRYSVKGGNLSTVGEEAQHIREYAVIIGYRFRGKISIEVDVPEEALECEVLRLLFQPIVENAVFHGLESRVGGGTVTARVRWEPEGTLVYTVSDNGIGMREELLQQTRKNLLDAIQEDPTQPSALHGIGLSNIARRLHLYYGDRGRIEIFSQDGQGTTVRVTIPQAKDGRSKMNVSSYHRG